MLMLHRHPALQFHHPLPYGAILHDAGVQFVIEPYIRFAGQVGEQATMFFYDPSNNAIEIKGFADMGQLFAK